MDGAKDKDTPTLMQLKCPPEVETQQNSTTEVTQTLLQLKDPPVFETWQHGTPDAALTLFWLKEAPEIDTLQHATTSSIASQLKDPMMTITHLSSGLWLLLVLVAMLKMTQTLMAILVGNRSCGCWNMWCYQTPCNKAEGKLMMKAEKIEFASN